MKWSRKWIVVNELDIHELELKTHVYWTIGHDFRSLVVLLSERSLNWVVIYCWRVNFIDKDHQFSHKFDTNQSWKGCFPLSGCRIYLNCVENKFSKVMVFYSNENCYLADVFFVIVVLLCVSVFWETVFFCFKANALLSRQKMYALKFQVYPYPWNLMRPFIERHTCVFIVIQKYSIGNFRDIDRSSKDLLVYRNSSRKRQIF